jgi:hypothetical protein
MPTETKRNTLSELQEKRGRAQQAADKAKVELDRLYRAQRAKSLEALDGGDGHGLEEIEAEIATEQAALHRAQLATEEAESLIRDEEDRLAEEDRKTKETVLSEALASRGEALAAADKALTAFERSLRAAILTADPAVRAAERALERAGENVPEHPGAGVAALRDLYTDKLNAIFAALTEAARPDPIQRKLTDLRERLAEARRELVPLEEAARQSGGLHDAPQRTRAWNDKKDEIKRLEIWVQILEHPEASEATLMRVEAYEASVAPLGAVSETEGEPSEAKGEPSEATGLVAVPRNRDADPARYERMLGRPSRLTGRPQHHDAEYAEFLRRKERGEIPSPPPS